MFFILTIIILSLLNNAYFNQQLCNSNIFNPKYLITIIKYSYDILPQTVLKSLQDQNLVLLQLRPPFYF